MRNLEREIASICRKVARKVVVEGAALSEEIDAEKVHDAISACRASAPTMAEEKNEIGVATGLAWTEVGGEILVDRNHADAGQGAR